MAVWKQFVVVVFLALAGLAGWGAWDPAARDTLIGLGVPPKALPEALFLPASDSDTPTVSARGEAAGGSGPSAVSGSDRGKRAGVPGARSADGAAPADGGRGGNRGGNNGASGGRGPGGPITVVTAPAGAARTNDRVNAVGTGEADRTVTIFPRAAGMVDALEFRPGEKVESGAVLVRLDEDAEAIALARAEVTLADARAKLERYERLAESRSISAVERDTARSELAAAELAQRQAQLDLDRRKVKAPFAGWVGLTGIEVGDMVSSTTEIVTIDDRALLKVEFRIPESHAARVALGQEVTATTPSRPGETFSGTVSAIGSRIEEDSRTLVVQARLDNSADRLRPGMSFHVTLMFSGDDKVAVPALSVQWDRDGSFVWRVVADKAERVPVGIVERNAETVLVEGALAVGDVVVVEGVQRLRPGATVASAAPDTAEPPAEAAPAPARRG